MNRAARIGILSVSVVIFCYAGIGHVLGRTPDDRAYKSLTVYGDVLQKIQSDYVDEPNMRLVTAGSLSTCCTRAAASGKDGNSTRPAESSLAKSLRNLKLGS